MSAAETASTTTIVRHRNTSITKTACTLPRHHSNPLCRASVMCHVPRPYRVGAAKPSGQAVRIAGGVPMTPVAQRPGGVGASVAIATDLQRAQHALHECDAIRDRVVFDDDMQRVRKCIADDWLRRRRRRDGIEKGASA